MVQDESEPSSPQASTPVSRVLVFGGVAAACALGAGLGLWARPVQGEAPGQLKPASPAPEIQAAADHHLQVVVNKSQTPAAAKPLDVLPAPPVRGAASAPFAPEPQAPHGPPDGLVRVDAPEPGPLAAIIPHARAVRPAPLPPKPLPVIVHAPPAPHAAPHVVKTKAERPRAPEPRKAHIAKAERVKAKTHAERLAKVSPPRHAEIRPHEEQAAETVREAKTRRAIFALAHVVARIATHHEREEARDERHEARADTAAQRPRKATLHEARETKPAAKKPPRRERFVPPLNTKGAGPIRVATVTTRCVSPDPGEALTCGDPALGAAERRMNRAYRDAEAAGVSQALLEQQQQKWLSARAAAAREAPWAVREVYQARIAELQDMTRSAQGN